MKRALALGLLPLLAFACDDDDDDSGGEPAPLYSSGLDEARLISDLDEAEVEEICVGIEAASRRLISLEQQCLIVGLMFGEDPSGCALVRDACVRGGQAPASQIDAPTCALRARSSACEATVEALDACIDFTLGEARDQVDALSCAMVDDLQSLDLQALPSNEAIPEPCRPLAELCPQLLEPPPPEMEQPQPPSIYCESDERCPEGQACVDFFCE